MSQVVVEKVLGRLITDAAFRHKAEQSLVEACRDEGYLLTQAELDALGRTKLFYFEHLADRLDSSIKRFSLL